MKSAFFAFGTAIIFSLFSTGHVYAQTAVQQQVKETVKPPGTNEAAENQASQAGLLGKPENVDYQLPYPGILTDHPLYILKNLRDRILEALIADPVKKSEFYLLQSDKFLAMGLAYEGSGKWEMVKNMVELSQANMTRAVTKLVETKNSGALVPGYTVDRLEKSVAKHIEVLNDLAGKAVTPIKEVLIKAGETVETTGNDIGKLK